MIFFDRTQKSVVVGCRPCGCREVTTTQEAAETWAMAHIERAHPAPTPEKSAALHAQANRNYQRNRTNI